MRRGEDVRCIIEIGSSKYNFTIESANFVSAFNEAFPEEAIAVNDETPSTAYTDIGEANTGDIIAFGNNESGEQISWRVLDKQDDKILVISEYILFEKPFYTEFYHDLNWSNSSLNTWLNSEFLTNSFSEEEQSRILESEHVFYSFSFDDTGKTTSQKIYLLNKDEVEQYFSSNEDRIAFKINDKSIPDYWHLSDGWIVDKSPYHYIVLSYINHQGELTDYPLDPNQNANVRPAMWISIE